MSSVGLLSFFDTDTNTFKTVNVHHIEESLSKEHDSFCTLMDFYNTASKAKAFFSKGFFLSFFDKSHIEFSEDGHEVVEHSTIDELIEYGKSYNYCSIHYVFYSEGWFSSPLDVKNIYFEKNSLLNIFKEEEYLTTKIQSCEFFICKSICFQDNCKNDYFSKVTIFYPENSEPVVLCIKRYDIRSRSVCNQAEYIYESLINIDPSLRNAAMYELDPCNKYDHGPDYYLQRFYCTEDGSFVWSNLLKIDIFPSEHNVDIGYIESLLEKHALIK